MIITTLLSKPQATGRRGQGWQDAWMLKGFVLISGTSTGYLWVAKNYIPFLCLGGI